MTQASTHPKSPSILVGIAFALVLFAFLYWLRMEGRLSEMDFWLVAIVVVPLTFVLLFRTREFLK